MAKRSTRRPQHFLVKSEPYKFSWADLVRDGRAVWDGVRNFEARNNLRAMRPGDLLLFYHSNEGKEVVGVAEVVKAAYPDPTAPGEDWSVVDVAPRCALQKPVTLAAIKATPALAEMGLLRRSRLSVVPVTAAEFTRILKMGKTTLDAAAATARTALQVPA
jgi:predicted RNA-binding protein with PUA-like domain